MRGREGQFFDKKNKNVSVKFELNIDTNFFRVRRSGFVCGVSRFQVLKGSPGIFQESSENLFEESCTKILRTF